MKFFLVLLAVVAAVSAEFHIKHFEDLMKFHDECGTENGIAADHVAKYKNQEYGQDDESYCHVRCVAKKVGIFDEEHGVLVDEMIKQVAAANGKTEDEVRPIIEECKTSVEEFKSNSCLWAYKGFVCLKKHNLNVTERKH
ncbi:general odorant-binding protein 99a-like [Culicoides brevitarsis]|uniref:general odorant-binding protein 99a-like n=1 Tax=Culicoides brevitarsis TaxID=469753 RepID=UPI00307C4C4A